MFDRYEKVSRFDNLHDHIEKLDFYQYQSRKYLTGNLNNLTRKKR